MKNNNSSTRRELFKKIPSINDLCEILDISSISYPQNIIKQTLRKTLLFIRKDIQSGNIDGNIKKIVIDRAKKDIIKITSFNLASVINGTGIVLHTGLGRSPLSKKIVLESFERLYPYSNLEFNIEKNSRGDRNGSIQNILNPLMGSQSAVIVNNCAAALLLTLNTLSDNKEVIISRGQQIEIGGSFRIPDVIKKSGSIIKDVGTTNKTHPSDYQNAVCDKTGLILYAHTSNYRVVGFTEKIKIKELSKIAKKNKVPMVVDAGSGCISQFQEFGMPAEKTVKAYFKEGADIVMFSGDKLLGGPQCGIICGKKKYIDLIKKNSLYRALRSDKITFAILESTLRAYLLDNKFDDRNLAINLLIRDRKKLMVLGKKIMSKIPSSIIKQAGIELVDTMVEAGSGAMPINSLESVAIIFTQVNMTSNKLSKKFRSASSPIIGYIKDDKYIIDLKAIPDDCFERVAKTISKELS